MRERLEREFNLDLISTAPNVIYDVVDEAGNAKRVTNPSEFPEGKVATIREPMVACTIIAPSDYIGAIMELCQSRRGQMGGMDYLSEDRVEMRYRCRWPRSFLTSSISSSPVLAGTHRWIGSLTARKKLTW